MAKKIAKNIKFEEALAELEEQVRLLESGELSLEQSLEVFKYGIELSKVCMCKLDSVLTLSVILQVIKGAYPGNPAFAAPVLYSSLFSTRTSFN